MHLMKDHCIAGNDDQYPIYLISGQLNDNASLFELSNWIWLETSKKSVHGLNNTVKALQQWGMIMSFPQPQCIILEFPDLLRSMVELHKVLAEYVWKFQRNMEMLLTCLITGFAEKCVFDQQRETLSL